MSLLLRTWWCRRAAHAVAASLLVQMLGIALHLASVPRLEAGADAGAFGTLLICSAPGLKSVRLDDQGNVIEAPGAPRPGESGPGCPLCLALGGCGLAAPVIMASIRAPVALDVFGRAQADDSIDSNSVLILRNRGPPSAAVV